MTVERKRSDVDEIGISHAGPDDPIPRTGMSNFYFDNIDAVCSSNHGNNSSSSSSSSPLASDPPTVGVATDGNVFLIIYFWQHTELTFSPVRNRIFALVLYLMRIEGQIIGIC
jgi:hypothetical protein